MEEGCELKLKKLGAAASNLFKYHTAKMSEGFEFIHIFMFHRSSSRSRSSN